MPSVIASVGVHRPFPPAVTSATVTIGAGLNTTQINDLIDGAANGTLFSFAAGTTYNLTAGIRVTNMSNLVFEGNGATLQMSGVGTDQLTSPFLLGWSYGGGYWTGTASHIEIRNFILSGTASPVGQGGQGEEQAGIKTHSATYVEVHHNTIRAVTADAYQVESTDSDHHWFHDNIVESCGRDGLTVGGGQHILVERNQYQSVGDFTINLEPTPGYPSEIHYVTFRDNDPCDWSVWGGNGGGFFSVDGSFTGWAIDNVVVANNRVTGGSLYSQFDNGNGVNGTGPARNPIVVMTGNVTTGGSVAGPVINIKHVDNLIYGKNTQTVSSGSLYNIVDSTGVTVI